jgi:hypothetical protein
MIPTTAPVRASALALAALATVIALSGCAAPRQTLPGTPIDPSAAPSASATDLPSDSPVPGDPVDTTGSAELDAGVLRITTFGSSSCRPSATGIGNRGDELVVDTVTPGEVCTADFGPRSFEVAVPGDVTVPTGDAAELVLRDASGVETRVPLAG